MTQDADLDDLVRKRIRSLRTARGWSLDDLASRCYLSPSTLSRIETGHRRIALDQLAPIARALNTTLDQLIEAEGDADVVIRPQHDAFDGMTVWPLTRESGPNGVHVMKMRIENQDPRMGANQGRVHPGKDWFLVLSGTVLLLLGDRTIRVEVGQAAEFSTMIPHLVGATGGPAEILCIFDHDGERTHMRPAS